MPSRRSAPPDPPRRPRLTRSREEAKQLLEARIALGEELASRINPGAYLPGALAALEAEYSGWSDYNEELLRMLFDTDEVADDYDPHFYVA